VKIVTEVAIERGGTQVLIIKPERTAEQEEFRWVVKVE
jgi:hypothetical protein